MCDHLTFALGIGQTAHRTDLLHDYHVTFDTWGHFDEKQISVNHQR